MGLGCHHACGSKRIFFQLQIFIAPFHLKGKLKFFFNLNLLGIFLTKVSYSRNRHHILFQEHFWGGGIVAFLANV